MLNNINFLQIVTFFALVAVTSAGLIPEYQQQNQYQSYAAAPQLIKQNVEYADAPAQYEFAYEVHDEHTGDIKSQKESRHGDEVQGQYSLIDADGYRRTVTYQADDHHGFNAQVHREPTNIKIAQPIQKIIAQPLQYRQAQPAIYQAQPLQYRQAQPAVYQAQPLQYHAQPAIKIAQPIQNQYAAASHGASTSTSLHSPHAQYHY